MEGRSQVERVLMTLRVGGAGPDGVTLIDSSGEDDPGVLDWLRSCGPG